MHAMHACHACMQCMHAMHAIMHAMHACMQCMGGGGGDLTACMIACVHELCIVWGERFGVTHVACPTWQTIKQIFEKGKNTAKKRKTATVQVSAVKAARKKRKRKQSDDDELMGVLHPEDDQPEETPTQTDPLKGRIRESLADDNLKAAMRWYLFRAVAEEGTPPPTIQLGLAADYMRAQARALTLLELWGIARGDDVRGDSGDMSLGKCFGKFAKANIIGPDPFYQLHLLKDESKANKVGRPELTGATRHQDPLLCAINATATMLILRFGPGGIVGELPDFFDPRCDWPGELSFLTTIDATGSLPYTGGMRPYNPGHKELFRDMKMAAGLVMEMGDCATKLRSFGAMNACENQASHPEIERMGR